MTTTLADYQFEILPDSGSTSGVPFGIGLNVSLDDGGWDPGENEWQTQDGTNQVNGATAFGNDVLLGPTWAWAMHVNRDDPTTALTSLNELSKAWRARDIVERPGKMSVMRYRLAGRDRRVYGRPRRWAAPPNNRILGGLIPIAATFKLADAYTYDDLSQSTTIPFALTSTGGFTFPVTFPATTLPGGQRQGLITVGGDVAAFPVIRINGPISAPMVKCDNTWTLSMPALSLLAGQWVEIDTRPWAQSVLRNGLYSEAGKLARRIRLRDLRLTPGNHDISFSGVSVEGTATCAVTWRNTYDGI